MTIGVRPLIANDSVDVSGGTGLRAAGRRDVLDDARRVLAVDQGRARCAPATTAVPSVPALAIRNRRRVQSGLVEVAALRGPSPCESAAFARLALARRPTG